MAALPFPEVERPYEFVALHHDDEYPIGRGRIVSSSGLNIAVNEYDDHFVEEQVPWSNALQSRLRGRDSYLCGPLARYNLNFDKLFPEVQEAALSIGLTAPCRDPHRSLLVRLIEVLQAFEEALRIIERYAPPSEPCIERGPLRAATGYGASEAPRGMLYHRYSLDDEGTILQAKIVPPTSQNQLAMEEDLAALAPELASLPLPAATILAERAIRNHDPCISCAAHFLTLRIGEG
jgi:coenzyme F420-reducing hydrogenase alpha subunit